MTIELLKFYIVMLGVMLIISIIGYKWAYYTAYKQATREISIQMILSTNSLK